MTFYHFVRCTLFSRHELDNIFTVERGGKAVSPPYKTGPACLGVVERGPCPMGWCNGWPEPCRLHGATTRHEGPLWLSALISGRPSGPWFRRETSRRLPHASARAAGEIAEARRALQRASPRSPALGSMSWRPSSPSSPGKATGMACSKPENLESAIYHDLQEHNDDPNPSLWTADADRIRPSMSRVNLPSDSRH